MEIITFGGGQRIAECERVLLSKSDTCGRVVLLPIPTTRDNKYITGSSVQIDEVSAMVDRSTLVAGYNLPMKMLNAVSEVGGRALDLATDENFLIKNAELTARGTIGYILTHSKFDLSDMSVGVVGYGRIGIRLVRWLLLFGAELTVYTTRPEIALELCEMGISACVIGEKSDFSRLNILINTAPARQIDENTLPPELEIIDLASGSIFQPSSRLIKLSSIPEAFYPLSAGRIYADAVLGAIGGVEL